MIFFNVQSYITRWLVIRWNLKFRWVFMQIYSSWIIPQKNNLVLKIYDLHDGETDDDDQDMLGFSNPFVKNYLMKQTLQKNTWSNTTVMKWTGVLRMMRTKICIPALFVPLILTTLSMQDLTNNSCWRRLLFESVLFEKIVLSHNSIYKLKPLWLWMRNWNSLPSSSLNSLWPSLFWHFR